MTSSHVPFIINLCPDAVFPLTFITHPASKIIKLLFSVSDDLAFTAVGIAYEPNKKAVLKTKFFIFYKI